MTLAEFVAQWEAPGGKPILKAYLDPVGIPTIGVGTTRYPSGTAVRLGDVCTEADALRFLEHDLQSASDAVTRLVNVPLTEGQRISCVSLVYNIGEGAFGKSTLLRLLNDGAYRQAADEFPKWNRAAGRVLPGLVRRRASERALFLSQISAEENAAQPLSSSVLPPVSAAPQESAADSPDAQSPNPQHSASEAPMVPFLIPAITAAVELAPALGKLFGSGSEVSERNIKAAEKVVEVMKQVSGADTGEGAAKTLAADPAKAAEFREAVHVNMGDFLAALKEAAESDNAQADNAVSRNLKLAEATGGHWLYLVGILAAFIVGWSEYVGYRVLFSPDFGPEVKVMVLTGMVLLGFTTVLTFIFGASIAGRLRDAKEQS